MSENCILDREKLLFVWRTEYRQFRTRIIESAFRESGFTECSDIAAIEQAVDDIVYENAIFYLKTHKNVSRVNYLKLLSDLFYWLPF